MASQAPQVAGIVSGQDMDATAESIAALQISSGMIEWFPGGHTDPWNHVEAAMALSCTGRFGEAEAAYQWLADIQATNGSWHNYYVADGVEDDKIDTNTVAYIATGIWHHWLASGNRQFVDRFYNTVAQAIEFVLSLQTNRGEVIWARRPDATPWSYALVTGSSSISHSLGCAVNLANLVGDQSRSEVWVRARQRLVDVIANQPEIFEPKERWAMDWYYPVLTGAVRGDDGLKRMIDQWDKFVMPGKGVRCVSDQPWVTAAETAEASMALLAIEETEKAVDLFRWAQAMRDTDGSYFTGLVHPELVTYPDGERSAYSGAAMVLAADAIEGTSPTSHLFVDHR